MGLVASTAEEVVMVEVGDRVRVESEKVGVVTRRGVVTQALLAVFRSRGVGWSAPEAVWYLPVNCGPGRHKMILSPEDAGRRRLQLGAVSSPDDLVQQPPSRAPPGHPRG
jgi:hypothetical protein